MGKLTISMAIFNSYVSLPEGKMKSHKNGDVTYIKWWFHGIIVGI